MKGNERRLSGNHLPVGWLQVVCPPQGGLASLAVGSPETGVTLRSSPSLPQRFPWLPRPAEPTHSLQRLSVVKSLQVIPLRFIAPRGLVSSGLAFGLSRGAVYARLTGQVAVQGGTSLVTVTTFFSACILLSLGVIAASLALSTSFALGAPLDLGATTPTRQPATDNGGTHAS